MQTHVEQLGKRYPTFRYVGFLYEVDGDDLRVTFAFEIGEHKFFPKSIFRGVKKSHVDALSKSELDTYVFHLGLAEIPSYWKLTCSPTIIIEAGFLNEIQIGFWRKLIQKGMGEFFFVNDIVPFAPTIHIQTDAVISHATHTSKPEKKTASGVLVPVGGGKDSLVTLELLTKDKKDITLFSIGQDQATEKSIDVYIRKYGKTPRIHVDRILDPTLLELNARGYLNGHTPFSSVVAFTSILAAKLFAIPYIALSNERSANEETGVYHGVNINHQYSKTYEFESDFHAYVSQFIDNAPAYFSLLRPLYEIQIMKIFTRFPEYFATFRSCNIGKKENAWCGSCAKCLFVALLLSAFLPAKKVTEIFGKDLLADEELVGVLKQLNGDAQMKAFECVGTIDETRIALYLSWKQRQLEKPLPALLSYSASYIQKHEKELETLSEQMISAFDTQHSIPESFEKVVRNALT